MKNVHETIEDMMARLEEFESIIGMVRNNFDANWFEKKKKNIKLSWHFFVKLA